MNIPPKTRIGGWAAGLLVLAATVMIGLKFNAPRRAQAQKTVATPMHAATNQARALADTNAAPSALSASPPPLAAAGSTNVRGTNAPASPVVSSNASVGTNPTAAPAQPTPTGEPAGGEGDIQLSFQNANIDMIVQWLARQTGKSVVKHPRVQSQLTIVSSRKLPPREAINLVYRALSLEGFTTIETTKSILIVPDGQEPRMTPELLAGGAAEIPEGRQRFIRIFQLEHVPPAEVRDKIKSVLSDKATVEIVDRAGQLILTDYTENIRLAGELIKELDVSSPSDLTVEFLKLKHADAEEITSLLTQILSAQSGAAPSGPSSGSTVGGGNAPAGPRPPTAGPVPPGAPGGPGGPPSSGPIPSSPTGAASPGGAGQVKIWPDKTSNQLIVVAPKSKIPEIKELLAILDTEKVEDVTLRVLPLENVNAEALVREIGPLFQKVGARSAKDRVEITANSRSNSLIILSSEENFKAIQRLVAALDREEAQEKVMRAFPLTNADAEDVARQLEQLHEGKDSSMRYPFFIFSSSSPQQSQKASFVADRRRNAVIVQARPGEIESIESLIKVLDAPIGDNTLAPKIFRLRYVSATDMEDVLTELFLRQQQQRSYWDPYFGYYGGGGSGRDSTGGKLYGKIRITSEPYSNSIIITSNSPEGLAAVEEVLKELDSPSQAGETTMRLTLKFARATAVASSLNILFAKGGSPPLRQQPPQGQPAPQVVDPRTQQGRTTASQNAFSLEQETREDAYYSWLGGQQDSPFGRLDGRATSARPVSDLVGRVRVVPDPRSNSVLITGNLHFFPQVLKLINELDEPTPQVLIEAKIIEVESDFRDKLGVRWSPDRTGFTQEDMEDSILAQSGTDYRKFFAGGRGVVDASVDVNVLVQFLRKNTDAKILAEPQLSVADNELAKLFVGSQVPFLSGSLNTVEGGQNQSFDYRDVGVILEIIPHINNSDEVALKIRAESSSIRSGQTLFGAFILDTRNFRTDLIVKNNETVILGGIIQREQSNVNRKVPGLGSIPGLGWAFRKKDKVAREVELMVFLRPRITRSPEQARELLEEIERKAPLIREWREDKPVIKPESKSGANERAS